MIAVMPTLCLIQWIIFMKSSLSQKVVKIHLTKLLQLLQVKVLKQMQDNIIKTSPIRCFLLPTFTITNVFQSFPLSRPFTQSLPFNLSVVTLQDNCPHLLFGLCLTKLQGSPDLHPKYSPVNTPPPHLTTNSWHCDPILCEVLCDILDQSQGYSWIANGLIYPHADCRHKQTKWDFYAGWLASLYTSEWGAQRFGRPMLSTPLRQVSWDVWEPPVGSALGMTNCEETPGIFRKCRITYPM